MTAPAEQHLVAVWNPTYVADAIEQHARILRDFASRHRSAKVADDELYVWWGKMRSPNRQSPLPHLERILGLETELHGEENTVGRELQLYLTDYRSLYVALVGEITADDVRKENSESEHVPALYAKDGINCDCWFRLLDIRRIVSDDTESVVAELSKLSNTGYHDRPVSIYGGMVDPPLVVTRPDGARFFDDSIRGQLTEGRLWVEFDAERGGTGQTERDLRENSFGEEAWAQLDPAARSFIATADKLYRDHRGDAAFDFSPVLIDFAKAFEVQTNFLLRRALARVKPADRTVNIDGRSVDLANGPPLMLAGLARVIAEHKEINEALRKRIAPPLTSWFTASLPAILGELAKARGPAAHSVQLEREDVHRLRNQYIGVGCEGELVRLAKVRMV